MKLFKAENFLGENDVSGVFVKKVLIGFNENGLIKLTHLKLWLQGFMKQDMLINN